MKTKTNLNLVIFMLLSSFIYSQSDIQFKTTDVYNVDIASNKYYEENLLTVWEVNLKTKCISYQKGDKKLLFFYTNEELTKNENGEITIEFENSTEVIHFTSYYNYIKLLHYTKMDPLSSPRSYKKITTYSNYKLNDFFGITDYNIN